MFQLGGMIIINDLLPRAEKIAQLESEMGRINMELNKLKGSE